MHDALVAVARRPAFYTYCGVADTFEGRFDLLVILLALLLRRLQETGEEGRALGQELVDVVFQRFDMGLRELGVSDIGVPKRMKRLAQAFKGRTAAYYSALDASDVPALKGAISRNILDGRADAGGLTHYILQVESSLSAAPLDRLRAGLLPFPDIERRAAQPET
jgi:cytochrome b pre-mRNA-processing protein 3